MSCRHFVSFKELFRDDREPENRGVCTCHVEFEDWKTTKVAIAPVVDEEYCRRCQQEENVNVNVG